MIYADNGYPEFIVVPCLCNPFLCLMSYVFVICCTDKVVVSSVFFLSVIPTYIYIYICISGKPRHNIERKRDPKP
jgi:hypothetical protein